MPGLVAGLVGWPSGGEGLVAAPIKPSRPAKSGDCSATSFDAGAGVFFLRRSYTVCHVTPETATEQSIVESTSRMEPAEAAVLPAKQDWTNLNL